MVTEHVHISHVTKLGKDIPCVNLPAGQTCREDAPCFGTCYARRGRFAFSHNQSLLSRNLSIWEEAPECFEQDVIVAAFHCRFFRWHSSGDIPDKEYLEMMVRIAQKLPMTSFLCFTKKFELVNDYLKTKSLPDNLRIVFSVWGEWKPDNPYNLPVAYIRFSKKETDIPCGARECLKYCGDCVMSGCSCWDLKRGESVVFNEH